MIAINEITDHQNGCYRVAKMSSHALAEKMFEKYQRISANFSNCDEVYFQKRIIIKSGECTLKNNPALTVFLYCGINQFKTMSSS